LQFLFVANNSRKRKKKHGGHSSTRGSQVSQEGKKPTMTFGKRGRAREKQKDPHIQCWGAVGIRYKKWGSHVRKG